MDVAAPIRKPSDCPTRAVCVAMVRNMKNLTKLLGWFVIQYTMLP